MSDIYYAGNLEEGDDNIWDDSKLNDAYDKALKIANAEVAKRVAMSTNSQHKNKEGNTNRKTSKKNTNKTKNYIKWKAGMHCRAIYEEDESEYEAILLRIINDKECVVRFLGYENSEIVSLDTLKPSQGKEERNRQIAEALDVETEVSDNAEPSPNLEKMDYGSDQPHSLASTDKILYKKKKTSKKTKKQNFQMPDMPFAMPNIGALKNLGSMDIPLAPPPPLAFSGGRNDSEDQAISSMLLSWYMSGYYTGLYQGLKRVKENRGHP